VRRARLFRAGAEQRYFLDSICNASYRDTMLRVAAFIAAADFVELAEEPVDDFIIVELNGTLVARVKPEECATADGWYLEEPRKLRFCGRAIPGPGDTLSVRAKGLATSPECIGGDAADAD
jgi:hypothetical protein